MTTIPNLSNLTNLVTLGIISFKGSLVQEPNIEWIVRLHALRKFDLIVEDMLLPATDLSSLSQLQQLAITCVDPRSLTGLPSSIQELNLRDVMSPINWSMFSNLGNLSTLILVGYWLEEIQFDVLGKLRNLNRLRMCCCPLLETLTGLSCLKEIRKLEVDGLPQLPEILDLGELKSLQELSIRNCNSIKRLGLEDEIANRQYCSFE
ncbi:hypothetical protein NL676_009089 [Syzygium grande]|nr:hypothetical protein NL676_009089 [Syzygium grande]